MLKKIKDFAVKTGYAIRHPRRATIAAFKKFLPPLSRTEKEALESGTVGWDGELISGHPNWDKLFELKKPEFTAEEQAFLDGPVQKLCDMIDTWQVGFDKDLPPEVWQFMKDNGFFGLEVPKEHGGLGFSSQLHSAVVMKVSSRNIAAGVTVGVPNSLGPAELIHKYGTDEQKEHYLPRLAKGVDVPCFALTEPGAGSDAGSIEARGTLFMDGNKLSVRLNFEKRYITLAPISTLAGLAFKLEDPDNLLGRGQKDLGITVAMIKRDTPGLEMGARHQPMDLPFMNGTLKGKDVVIPADMIIGGPERAGEGWKMLMECLSVGRALSLPAMGAAGAQFSAYTTGAYSRVRRQFNTSINKFEGIEEVMGRMAGLTYMMNGARLATLQMVDQGQAPAIPSAILKYHLTENMRTLVNDAMDIHGGKAIINGPHNYYNELYKGIPVAITVEGANIMTRNLIIFGQGSVRAHPYLLKEINAANDPDYKKGFSALTRTLAVHVGNAIKSKAKSFGLGITRGRLAKVPKGVHKDTRRYYQQINRLCAAFNFASDATLGTLGGTLKFRERTSARLGDVFSNLYMASTALWYFEKMGANKEDLPLLHWACNNALYKAEQALDDLLRNHPNRFVGAALRPVIFPTGKVHKKPDDKMDRAAAEVLCTPGEARDRLTANLYKPTNPNEPLFKLEEAFRLSIETEGLERKLGSAVKKGVLPSELTRAQLLDAAQSAGVLNEGEMAAMRRMDSLRRDIVMVDSFDPSTISGNKAPAPKPWN